MSTDETVLISSSSLTTVWKKSELIDKNKNSHSFFFSLQCEGIKCSIYSTDDYMVAGLKSKVIRMFVGKEMDVPTEGEVWF